MTRHSNARLFLVLSAVCAFSAGSAGRCLAELQVIGIDVGQGDCTLIISPTGKTVLVDAGDTGRGTGAVLPYLQSRGISALDYTIASHYHADHIGGMDEVINALGLDSLRVAAYDRGWSYTTQAYTQYAGAVGSKRQTLSEYQVIDIGGGATLTCLGLNSMGRLAAPYDAGRFDENNLCVAMLLSYGEFQMLLAGDLPGTRSGNYYDIESLVAPRAGDVDVYKADHHGSATSSQTTLLNAIHPEAALVYMGDGNSYGHPTQSAINRLVAVNCYIYQTELGTGGTIPAGDGEVAHGNIVIDVDLSQYIIDGKVYDLGTVGADDGAIARAPAELRVFPNPFFANAVLSFGLRGPGRTTIGIFDVRGRLVNMFAPAAGVTTLTWDGRSYEGKEMPAGVYYIRMSGSAASLAQKIVKR